MLVMSGSLPTTPYLDYNYSLQPVLTVFKFSQLKPHITSFNSLRTFWSTEIPSEMILTPFIFLGSLIRFEVFSREDPHSDIGR